VLWAVRFGILRMAAKCAGLRVGEVFVTFFSIGFEDNFLRERLRVSVSVVILLMGY